MIELIAINDSRAMRNKTNVLDLYDLMINRKRSEEATAKFLSPSYIQHNPLIPDGSVALGGSSPKLPVRGFGHASWSTGSLGWATTCGHI